MYLVCWFYGHQTLTQPLSHSPCTESQRERGKPMGILPQKSNKFNLGKINFIYSSHALLSRSSSPLRFWLLHLSQSSSSPLSLPPHTSPWSSIRSSGAAGWALLGAHSTFSMTFFQGVPTLFWDLSSELHSLWAACPLANGSCGAVGGSSSGLELVVSSTPVSHHTSALWQAFPQLDTCTQCNTLVIRKVQRMFQKGELGLCKHTTRVLIKITFMFIRNTMLVQLFRKCRLCNNWFLQNQNHCKQPEFSKHSLNCTSALFEKPLMQTASFSSGWAHTLSLKTV